MDMDRQLLLWLNSMTAGHDGITLVVTVFASYLPYMIVVGFGVALWLTPVLSTRKKIICFVTALTAGLLARVCVTSLIRVIAPRPRPFNDPEVHKLIELVNNTAPSFPSGHASFLFAFVTAALIYDRRFGIPALGAAGLVSIGRVAAGVHYPSDVLVGMFIGIACGLLLTKPIGMAAARVYPMDSGAHAKTPRRLTRPGV